VRTTLIFIFSFAFLYQVANGQIKEKKIRSQALKKSIVDSLFVFGKWSTKGATETDLKYLGQLTTKAGKTFKILNSIWFLGFSHRATSRILIFNANNGYVGNYYMSTVDDLPTKLENGKLIFFNSGKDCDKNLVTTIDLKSGLPKRFFRKRTGKYGDIYSFEAD
jgi:hypothetical protein